MNYDEWTDKVDAMWNQVGVLIDAKSRCKTEEQLENVDFFLKINFKLKNELFAERIDHSHD